MSNSFQQAIKKEREEREERKQKSRIELN